MSRASGRYAVTSPGRGADSVTPPMRRGVSVEDAVGPAFTNRTRAADSSSPAPYTERLCAYTTLTAAMDRTTINTTTG